ncbi:MAG TPA: penicillin-binding protein 2 [Actinomycetota bacterium]
MTEGRIGLRLKILALLVAFMFAALTTRLWFLQVLAYEQNRASANSNAVRTVEVPAPRGRILDDQGNILVGNRMSLVVTVNRQEAGGQLEQVLFDLSKVLGVRPSELAARVDSTLYYVYQPVPVATGVSKRVAFYIEEHQDRFPGVVVVPEPVRTYPAGDLAAHVLGYLGQISEEKLNDPSFSGYEAGDLVGVSGVEAEYEHELRGTKGVLKYRVNSAGQNLGLIGHLAPQPGDDLVLTLDQQTQQLAEESLKLGLEYAHGILDSSSGKYLAANAGAVVVMDPTTGAIEAMASSPTFDPSLFTRSMSTNEFERRFGAATGFPLLNRALQGQYPPGSTYKPFVLLSALHRNLVTTAQGYECPPSWSVPEDPQHRVFSNWTTANLGIMSLAQALWDSCDTVFYPIGYDYWRIYYPPTDPPKEPLQHDLRADGFGQVTRVDLPGESPYSGRVPDAAWKAQVHADNPKAFPDGDWFPGDFVNMSIGQGDTLVTPLQLAQGYSAIMNDGSMCVPHVGLRIQTSGGKIVRNITPRCKRRLPYTAAQLDYVRQALSQVPVQGTASYAFRGFPFSQVWVAGKTGTAQVFGKQDYSWFAAMTRAQGKEYVVVALVEQGGHGSTTAAPIVRRVIEGLYGLPTTQFTTVGGTD